MHATRKLSYSCHYCIHSTVNYIFIYLYIMVIFELYSSCLFADRSWPRRLHRWTARDAPIVTVAPVGPTGAESRTKVSGGRMIHVSVDPDALWAFTIILYDGRSRIVRRRSGERPHRHSLGLPCHTHFFFYYFL